MDKRSALVADIQRASLHDGDGFRTTVFFKGCPLRCVWCHNPECIRFEKETLFYPQKCIGCGMCEQGCYAGAKVICGREMTAEEIFAEILADRPYYGTNGGVTFSGGEPLAHPEIVKELIALCRKEGIHTAVETSLYLFEKEILGSLDYVMADLKLWNDDDHQKYTGVSNQKILENFKRLDALGVPFTVRTPLIPGITDNKENIKNIRDFIRAFHNIRQYELLPYNPLGNAKREALGREKVIFDHNTTAPEELMQYADLSGQTEAVKRN